MAVDHSLTRKHSRNQLLRRHLERENTHRLLRLSRDARRDIKRETRLTHTRSRADKNKIALTHSDKHLIKVAEAGRRSHSLRAVSLEKMQMLISRHKHLADMREPLLLISLSYGKDSLLSVPEDM